MVIATEVGSLLMLLLVVGYGHGNVNGLVRNVPGGRQSPMGSHSGGCACSHARSGSPMARGAAYQPQLVLEEEEEEEEVNLVLLILFSQVFPTVHRMGCIVWSQIPHQGNYGLFEMLVGLLNLGAPRWSHSSWST